MAAQPAPVRRMIGPGSAWHGGQQQLCKHSSRANLLVGDKLFAVALLPVVGAAVAVLRAGGVALAFLLWVPYEWHRPARHVRHRTHTRTHTHAHTRTRCGARPSGALFVRGIARCLHRVNKAKCQPTSDKKHPSTRSQVHTCILAAVVPTAGRLRGVAHRLIVGAAAAGRTYAARMHVYAS